MKLSSRSLAVVSVFLLSAGAMFWPTLYRYDRLTGDGVSVPMRIHRLTGSTQVFVNGAWYKSGTSDTAFGERLPPSDLALLAGEGGFGYTGHSYGTTGFGVSLYNGSTWTLTRIIFEVSAIEPDGRVRWSRRFNKTETIPSLSSKYIHIELGGAEDAKAGWKVEQAFGRK